MHPESVFFGWYRSVFLGNYHTDTKGTLGQYYWYGRYEKYVFTVRCILFSRMFCHCVCVCVCVFVPSISSGIHCSANIMILNKTIRPPPKKTQHDTRNECFGGLSRSLRTHQVLAGKILTCMPAGDSKNEPHQEKKSSFFFQCGHAITRKHTSAASGAKIQMHNVIESWCLCSASALARSQGKTTKKNQNGVFFSS